MEKEVFNKYLKERFIKQQEYFSKKARKYKKDYEVIQFLLIISSCSLPVLISLKFNIASIITSLALAITSSVLKTYQFQEKAINFRTVSEQMKTEKFLFDTETNAYKTTADKEKLFVERVEQILDKEKKDWYKEQIELLKETKSDKTIASLEDKDK